MTAPVQYQNPCAVRAQPGVAWKGQLGVGPHGHLIFSGPQYSVRALARQLLALGRHGRECTAETIADACGLSGECWPALRDAGNALSVHHHIDVTDPVTLGRLIQVIARCRTHAELPDDVLATGLDLAGITPTPTQRAA